MQLTVKLFDFRAESTDICKGDFEIDYSDEDGIEVLPFQLLSQLPDLLCEDVGVVLVDYFGRLIESNLDLQNHKSGMYKLAGFVLNRDDYDNNRYWQFCTNDIISDNTSKIQPLFRFIDTTIVLCSTCQSTFDDGLIIASNLSQSRESLCSFECQSKSLVEMGFASSALETMKGQATNRFGLTADHPIVLFLLRHYYRQVLQHGTTMHSSIVNDEQTNKFRRRLDSCIRTVRVYDDPYQIRTALENIDFPQISSYYQQERIAEVNADKTPEEIFFFCLLRWFKTDFFEWCNRPKCAYCTMTPSQMHPCGGGPPNDQERQEGWAGMVELYRCQHCSQTTRFPRYNNPAYMMQHSRRGRCGEFANVFALICRALGFDIQYVMDFTDHVWVEVFIHQATKANQLSQGQFVHIDCCERAFHNPLLYEKGWGKKLTHVISCSRYGIIDSCSRYSRKLPEVIVRRHHEVVHEGMAQRILTELDAKVYQEFQQRVQRLPKVSTTEEIQRVATLGERLSRGKDAFVGANERELEESIITERRREQKRELEGFAFMTKEITIADFTAVPAENMHYGGRISGDEEWRRVRGELGSNA